MFDECISMQEGFFKFFLKLETKLKTDQLANMKVRESSHPLAMNELHFYTPVETLLLVFLKL